MRSVGARERSVRVLVAEAADPPVPLSSILEAAGMRVVGSRGAGGGGSRRGSGGFAFTASTNGTGRRTPDPRLAEELLR